LIDLSQNLKNSEPEVLRFVTDFPQKNPEPKVLSFAEKKLKNPKPERLQQN
jgi:hypothetical protein